MCSTPKPKSVAKVKATPRVVSILASMDNETRQRFAARANQAFERRELARQQEKARQLIQENKAILYQQQKSLAIKKQHRGLCYWLFSASFVEIYKKLMTSH